MESPFTYDAPVINYFALQTCIPKFPSLCSRHRQWEATDRTRRIYCRLGIEIRPTADQLIWGSRVFMIRALSALKSFWVECRISHQYLMTVHRIEEENDSRMRPEGVVRFCVLLTIAKSDLNGISFIYLLNFTFYGKL